MVSLGQIIIFYSVAFGISLVLVALRSKSEEAIYPCNIIIDESPLQSWLDNDLFVQKNYHVNCSTIYVELEVSDETTLNEMMAIGVNLSLTKPTKEKVEVLIYNANQTCFITLEGEGKITITNNS